ncbi:helix-turn-helix domain-containing protein [Dyella amyloliquefaciens]|uniref:helix-turn-helix domain-containing protein n=1 Tax=Dyella amyloliquefaciens TaxID=1770545 RepID=UPI00102EB0AB|nr:helix-turn-helix transcriptional regulator [Dyella amyloliquefaciens]
MRAMEIKYPLGGSDLSDTFGARLRLAREHARLTIDQATSRVSGLSVKRLTNMELGTDNGKSPDMVMLQRIADVYQVKAMWLCAGALAGDKFMPEWLRAKGGAV